jgi:hypothetical protein
MPDRNVFTRVYSGSSAAQLVSAKGSHGRLSHRELLEEFRKHAGRQNREATALVSTSDRIVDTVNRAVHKHHVHGDKPEDIWIVFIEVPITELAPVARFHAAHLLAKECELPKPDLFIHKIVFEWAIPAAYVLHRVSLQTLMGRGLEMEKFLARSGSELRVLLTRKVRRRIASDLQPTDSGNGPFEIGTYLANFAQVFGAGAPLRWISVQLFCDCVRFQLNDEVQVAKLWYANGQRETVDFEIFCRLEDRIKTALRE